VTEQNKSFDVQVSRLEAEADGQTRLQLLFGLLKGILEARFNEIQAHCKPSSLSRSFGPNLEKAISAGFAAVQVHLHLP
jgi:hypothetical protein